MNAQSRVHNGGPVPVVLYDDGRTLEPGDTVSVELTDRVQRLLERGSVVTPPEPEPIPSTKTGRNRTEKE